MRVGRDVGDTHLRADRELRVRDVAARAVAEAEIGDHLIVDGRQVFACWRGQFGNPVGEFLFGDIALSMKNWVMPPNHFS